MQTFNSTPTVAEEFPTNPRDYGQLILQLIIAVVGFYGIIIGTAYGPIYTPLIIFAFTIDLIGLLYNNNYLAAMNWGLLKPNEQAKDPITRHARLIVTVGLALLFAAFLGYVYFFIPSNSSFAIFQFVSAPTAFDIGAISLSGTLLLVLLEVIAPEAEEGFFSASLVPTITLFFRKGAGITIVIALVGIAFTAVLKIYLFSIAFIFLAIIFLFSSKLNLKFEQNKYVPPALAIFFIGILFALYHYYAFQSQADIFALFLKAAIFFWTTNTINFMLKNTIFSRIAHSGNNMIIGISALGATLAVDINAAIIFTLYIIALLSIYKYGDRFSLTRILRSRMVRVA